MKPTHLLTPPQRLRTFRPITPESRVLIRNSYELRECQPVAVVKPQVVTYDHRTHLALIVEDTDERSTIPHLHILVGDVRVDVYTFATIAAGAYMSAIRQSSTDLERSMARTQYGQAMYHVAWMMQPYIKALSGRADDELFPASVEEFPL